MNACYGFDPNYVITLSLLYTGQLAFGQNRDDASTVVKSDKADGFIVNYFTRLLWPYCGSRVTCRSFEP
jgi:hypothetical protein